MALNLASRPVLWYAVIVWGEGFGVPTRTAPNRNADRLVVIQMARGLELGVPSQSRSTHPECSREAQNTSLGDRAMRGVHVLRRAFRAWVGRLPVQIIRCT